MNTYIGIDISKYKHDFCIISSEGKIIIENSSFENNKKGFQLFLDQLEPFSKTNIQIAFEATGNYSMNLELFLINNDLSFMKINPLIIHQFLKARSLRKTKTDKADSLTIARFLMSVPYQPNSNTLYNIFTLKSLCRAREKIIKEKTKFANLLTNALDMTFPEMKSFFGNEFTITMLYILEKYKNPKHIALMKDYDTLRKISRGQFTYIQFSKLKDLAKNSVGYCDENTDLLVLTYVNAYNFMKKQALEIETEIRKIIKKINPKMLTIPGIGELTAASILSEYGDISNFSNADKMLAFAGLDPSISQSGTTSKNGKMVKHGSGHLRYVLMNVSIDVIRKCPYFYDYYHKKREEGKSHRVALSHVCKKLIRIIFKLEKNAIDFDPNLTK